MQFKSDQKFEDSLDLLLLIDDDESHFVYILKVLSDLCFIKQKIKAKNGSVKVVHSVLVVKMCSQNKEGITEFENYFKQIPVPFKIYSDFECNLEQVESYEGSYTKNIKITFLVVLLTKLFVLMIGFTKPIVVFRGENAAYEFIKAILKEYKYL